MSFVVLGRDTIRTSCDGWNIGSTSRLIGFRRARRPEEQEKQRIRESNGRFLAV